MMDNMKQYRESVNRMGKKEFTLIKMEEYGFWPEDMPKPYERQLNETPEEFEKRQKLEEEKQEVLEELNKLISERSELYENMSELNNELRNLSNYDFVRDKISKEIMEESIERRKQRKEQRLQEKKEKSEAWKKYKSENIVYIGKGYSYLLKFKETDEELLNVLGLPIIRDDKELAEFLDIPYKSLRFLTYHRDVVKFDNYTRYTIPKKKGGERNIAAPNPTLKKAQRIILDKLLYKLGVSDCAHGFLTDKSILSGAMVHKNSKVELLINMDLEDFFPTIDFKRVVGMFTRFGYSGYVSSLLAMICTYCERMKMEIKGEEVFVKTSDRILPQGAPTSPMITNIICRNLDRRLQGLSKKYKFTYSRYADDMSFSFDENSLKLIERENLNIGKILGIISKIVKEEGFKINNNKTKFLRENNRQSVTGIVINNDEISVPKVWIKKFRATIYNAKKLKDNGENIPFKTINEIRGMISWVSFVNKEKYSKIIDDAKNVLKN